MSEIAIKAEKLSKKYTLTRGGLIHYSITERVNAWLSSLAQRESQLELVRREDIWPLKDVSFEVKQGEVVGIIGRNGAGKSTLLKILSRITEPTSGRAVIRGRVGTLLEVGTGFHPDLTGRENIYLSGSVLGMKKSEIKRKFDEIVAFADIEKFIDTPVKRYSSGMYVRLAFAVGANLDPEILIVDEVLAVGDSQFQQKCLNKMQTVGEEGRTVLFVSHNMPSIARLCKRAIFLDQGRIVKDGPAQQVVSTYMLSAFNSQASQVWPDGATAPGDDVVRLRAVRVRTADGRITGSIDVRQSFSVELDYEVLKPNYQLVPSFHLLNEYGDLLFISVDLDPDWRNCPRPAGRYVSSGWIPGNLLRDGTFFIRACCDTLIPFTVRFATEQVAAFQVVDGLDDDSARGDYKRELGGLMRPMLKWTTQFTPPMSQKKSGK